MPLTPLLVKAATGSAMYSVARPMLYFRPGAFRSSPMSFHRVWLTEVPNPSARGPRTLPIRLRPWSNTSASNIYSRGDCPHGPKTVALTIVGVRMGWRFTHVIVSTWPLCCRTASQLLRALRVLLSSSSDWTS